VQVIAIVVVALVIASVNLALTVVLLAHVRKPAPRMPTPIVHPTPVTVTLQAPAVTVVMPDAAPERVRPIVLQPRPDLRKAK
jgi:hypothetical protein